MPEQYQAHASPVLWRVRRRDGQPLIPGTIVVGIEKRAQFAHEIWLKHRHEWGLVDFNELEFKADV